MRRIGRIREKLAHMLSEELERTEGVPIAIEPDDFWIQEGGYRKPEWDLASWGVDRIYTVEEQRRWLVIFSWNTMTECVKKGFTVIKPQRSSPHEREVCVKE